MISKDEVTIHIRRIRCAIKRRIDHSFPDELERELLGSESQVSYQLLRRWAKWCNTNGNPYRDAMPHARELSILLFGKVLDRSEFGV